MSKVKAATSGMIKFPGHAAMRAAIKQLNKEKTGADEIAVCDNRLAEEIYDGMFKAKGPLAAVEESHRANAWLRVMQYFIKNGTTDKAPPAAKGTFRVYTKDGDENRVAIEGQAIRALIISYRCTVRAYWRAYARTAIEFMKEHPKWSSSFCIKWGVPVDKYYLAADFLDRMGPDDIKELGLTNEDCLIINNTTFANTQRAAMNQEKEKLTSNSTIFNPGRRVISPPKLGS